MKFFNFSIPAAVALAVCSTAKGDLNYTFSSDAEGFTGVSWSSGVPGWAGGGLIKASTVTGGWTLGSSAAKEFAWSVGGGAAIQQVEMQNLAASGNARFSFDLVLDNSSFPTAADTWYSINIAGNSGGSQGWTQIDKLTGDAWHVSGDNTLLTSHFDYSFAQLGWANGDGWYQVWFGANSASGNPIQFYLDNVSAYMVPEPGFFALAGLAAGLMVLRRRN